MAVLKLHNTEVLFTFDGDRCVGRQCEACDERIGVNERVLYMHHPSILGIFDSKPSQVITPERNVIIHFSCIEAATQGVPSESESFDLGGKLLAMADA